MSRVHTVNHVSGPHPSNLPGWPHFQASLWPHFRTSSTYQVRIPKGEPLELRVTRLGVDTGRRPQFRQIWSVNPQLHIVDLETDRGPKELAALPSRLMELQVRLGQ